MSTNKTIMFLFLMLFYIQALAEDDPGWAKADYISNSFVEIALRDEYSDRHTGIRKWIKPIKYYILHRVPDKELHQRLVKFHLNHLADITGITMQAVAKKKDANLVIVFSSENKLKAELKNVFGMNSSLQRNQFFRHSVCLATMSLHRDGSIKKAAIIIPVDRARAHAKLVSCVVEELTQVMGLPNDSEKVFPSIFNDKSFNDLLTGLDYVLLKILYHPMLKPGMKENRIQPIVKKIIKEFYRKGIIAKADKKVLEGELYALF